MENGDKVRICPKLWRHCSVVLSVHPLHVGDTFYFFFFLLSRGNQWIVGLSNCTLLKLHPKDQIWEWTSVDLQAWFSVIIMKMYHDFVPLFCSVCLFSVYSWPQLWAGDAEELRNQDTFYIDTPFSSPFVCRCVLKLYAWELPPTILSSFLQACVFFFREGCIIICLTGIYYLLLSSFSLWSAAGMLPAGWPTRKHPSKERCFAPGWHCCQPGRTACAVKPYVAYTVLEKRWNGFCWLIWAGKSRLLGMGWTNLKEELWQQPRAASPRRQLELICYALTVFSPK